MVEKKNIGPAPPKPNKSLKRKNNQNNQKIPSKQIKQNHSKNESKNKLKIEQKTQNLHNLEKKTQKIIKNSTKIEKIDQNDSKNSKNTKIPPLPPNLVETLKNLPSAKRYERSYLHRAQITHICASQNDFLITASSDGVLKFWRNNGEPKKPLIFVKEFKSHDGPICGFALSPDGTELATASEKDRFVRFYDVENFDMVNFLNLEFSPRVCCWISDEKNRNVLALSEKESGKIHFMTSEGNKNYLSLTNIHQKSVNIIEFNKEKSVVISCDEAGHIEYWDFNAQENFPYEKVKFNFKTSTDLYFFIKKKLKILSLNCSNNGEMFVTNSEDQIIRLWNFQTGKIVKEFNESLQFYENIQISNSELNDNNENENALTVNDFVLESFDYGQRAAKETKRISNIKENDEKMTINAIFDHSDQFLIFSTIVGIKIIDIKTGNCRALLGKEESSERFLKIALTHHNKAVVDSAASLYLSQNKHQNQIFPSENSENVKLKLICSSFRKPRLFVFTACEPAETFDFEGETRDVNNEKPSSTVDRKAKSAVKKDELKLPQKVILRTSKGDIYLRLFSEECPKTVENFTTLCKKGYYNGHIFHRVIKQFMVQTGDPTGTGCGGESIWGSHFKDEIHPSLKHDKAGVLAMANAGPNTNGSQFFITVRPAPWLDGKHTVFGQVEAGMDSVFEIERVRVDGKDRPLEPPTIINATVKNGGGD